MNESLNVVNRLLVKIRSGRAGRDEVIVHLYKDKKLRNSFRKMIRNQGWPASSFDTIFTDAIVTFVSSVIKREDFELNSDLNNYIIVIGKRTYMRKLKKRSNAGSIDEIEVALPTVEEPLHLVLNSEKEDLVQAILERLGRNCREVLMYWANDYSMKEIAEKMQYKSDMMARKKKYKCFKELMELIQTHPEIKNLLM